MTWYEEIVAEQNIIDAMEKAEISEIPFALVDELLEDVEDGEEIR